MYIYQEFPKWKYHSDGRAVTVEDPEQEQALGPGWADTPAAAAEPGPDSPPDSPADPSADQGKGKRKKAAPQPSVVGA